MIWKQNRNISNEYIENLANELNTSSLLVRILLNRKNDEQFARIVLRDIHEAIIEPELLVNGQEVASVIARHIKNDSIILIHADYDADGINGGYLMNNALREIVQHVESKAEVEVYFPERVNGYGLSMYFAEKVLEMKQNTDKDILVLTVDNGIAQVEQINYLIDNGIEVVVTDHHESKEIVPNCLICDPHNKHIVQDETYSHLCGTAVAFKICELVQKAFGYHDMYKYVANVAIATITDVMPLTEENIAFIKYGLEILNSEYCPAGISAMKEFLGIDVLNSQHIAWEIGPRLNACGRMGNTKLGGALLSTTDYEDACDLVNQIEILNDTRKDLTKKAQEQMENMNFDNDAICLIELSDIPEGIVGVIAGRAVEKFGKPSIVVIEHDGLLKGSARSIEGVNILPLLKKEEDRGTVVKFGGHEEAAGVQIVASKKQEFISGMNNSFADLICTQSVDKDYTPTEEVLMIDECIEICHLNKETFELINDLPYDKAAFSKPTFALVDCKVKDYAPTKSNPDNLWLTVQQGRQTIKLWCQGMTETYKSIGCPNVIHLAGHIEKNFMSGRPYILKVVDIADAS